LALLLAVAVAGSCGFGKTDKEYVDTARKFLDNNQYQAAIIELKNALGSNGANSEARFLLGKTYFETGNYLAAEKEFSRAQDLGDQSDRLLPLMAQNLNMIGKHDEVLALKTSNLNAAAAAQVLATQAIAAFYLGDKDQSQKLLDSAFSSDPDSIFVLITRARLLLAAENISDARSSVSHAMEIEPENPAAYSILGDIERLESNFAMAEQAYSQALKLSPENATDRLHRVHVRILQDKWQQAQEDVEILIKTAPKSPSVNYVLGQIRFHNEDIRGAIDAWLLVGEDRKNYPLQPFYLALANYKLGNFNSAEKYANDFYLIAPNNILGRKLLAELVLANKEYKRVENLLRPVVEENEADIDALKILAPAMAGQGAIEEAIELYQKIASMEPESPAAHIELAKGYLLNGDAESALEQAEIAVELDNSSHQSVQILVAIHLQQKQFKEAIKVATDYLNIRPNTVEPYVLLAKVHVAAGQDAEAKRVFKKALEIEPADPEAAGYMIDLAIKGGEYKAARQLCKQVLDAHQNHLPTMLRVAQLDLLEKGGESLEANLQRIIEVHPTALQPRIGLARYYKDQGSAAKSEELLGDLANKSDPYPPLLELLAQSQLIQSDYLKAKETLEDLLQIRPDSARAHFLLSRAYAGLDDPRRTEKALNDALRLDPNNFEVNVMLAKIYLLRNELDDAEARIEVLQGLDPEHLEVLSLNAEMLRRKGKDTEALTLYKNVFDKSPTTEHMLQLAAQSYRMGNPEAAIELQQSWLGGHETDVEARMALASLYNRIGEQDKSIAEYEKIVQLDQGNGLAFNNLAYYLRKINPEKALQYAQKAVSILPYEAIVLDTMAVVLLENDQIKRAQSAMEQALEKDPGNPSIRYHSALIDHSAGRIDAAVDTLSVLLGEKADFPEKEAATDLYRQLVPVKSAVSHQD